MVKDVNPNSPREAIKIPRIANNTEFGLGAAIFSKNIERAEKLAKQIQTGTVAINDFVKIIPGKSVIVPLVANIATEISFDNQKKSLQVINEAGKKIDVGEYYYG